jgi:hypothetical protein
LILEKQNPEEDSEYEINKPSEFESFFNTYFPEDIEVKDKSTM